MSDLRSTIANADTARRRWRWAAAAIALVLAAGIGIVLARGGGSSSADAGAAEPQRGGTLQFALIDYQRSPDPQWGTNYAESLIGNNVTDKLTWQDPDTGEITPWLAQSWEHNEQLTEFTFHLRRDVTFSDGAPLNAEVVKSNFDQYVHGDPALDILPNGAPLLDDYRDTQVVDEFTARVRFDKPHASFLQASSFTANAQPGLLSPATLKLSAQERTDPKKVIGTGPFVYEAWEPQVKTVLSRREDYRWAPAALHHPGAANLDRIVFNTIPESSVRTGSLASGTIDATLDVGTTDEKPLTDQGFQIVHREVSGTAIRFDLNSSLFPTNDIAVRKAVQLGWDRRALQKSVLTDSYSVANSILSPSVPGHVDYSGSVLRHAPEQANRILDEAGWVRGADGIRVKDGRKLEIKLLGINNLVVNKPAYESVQQDLRDILPLRNLRHPVRLGTPAPSRAPAAVVALNRRRSAPETTF